MKILGIVLVLLGLMLMRWGRDGESGLVGALVFLFGLGCFSFGIYVLFFEEGDGLAAFLPFLK